MTSTLSPNDTGEIALGTRDLSELAYLIRRPPPFRRPNATGEQPLYRPQTIGDVDELARLALEATLVHEVPLPPIDSLPEAVRRPAPTVHRAGPPEPFRPAGYWRTSAGLVTPWVAPSWPWLVLPLVGAALMLLSQVALLQVAIRVSGAVL